jgi:hypothetical protein
VSIGQKVLPTLRLDPWTIQPIVSCYTSPSYNITETIINILSAKYGYIIFILCARIRSHTHALTVTHLFSQERFLHLKNLLKEQIAISTCSTSDNVIQDRQHMYIITLRHICRSLLPWKSNEYSLLICV